jgi:hypothetical protein
MGTKGDMLMTSKEVNDAMEAAHEKVELRHPDHLYVPGKVILMYEHWQDEVLDVDGESDNLKPVGDLRHYCSRSDGTMSVLRFFEIDGYRLLSDHVTASYYLSLASLNLKTHNDDANGWAESTCLSSTSMQ